MKDLTIRYCKSDTLQLTGSVVKKTEHFSQTYGLDHLLCISLHRLNYQCILYKSVDEEVHIPDTELYILKKNGLEGGISVVHRHRYLSWEKCEKTKMQQSDAIYLYIIPVTQALPYADV